MKTAGRIKEGKKKAVAKVERIPVKMKRRKTEEKKEAAGGRLKDEQKRGGRKLWRE